MIEISTGTEAIAIFGLPKIATRKTFVSIREVNGREIFHSKYVKGDLVAEEGIDYVVIPVDGSNPYPCKIDIFHSTWEELEGTSGVYRKKAKCKAIPIPENLTIKLNTREGSVEVSHPNYIAIGADNEVYSYSSDWIANNLNFIN
jgi:hypothetical protein